MNQPCCYLCTVFRVPTFPPHFSSKYTKLRGDRKQPWIYARVPHRSVDLFCSFFSYLLCRSTKQDGHERQAPLLLCHQQWNILEYMEYRKLATRRIIAHHRIGETWHDFASSESRDATWPNATQSERRARVSKTTTSTRTCNTPTQRDSKSRTFQRQPYSSTPVLV